MIFSDHNDKIGLQFTLKVVLLFIAISFPRQSIGQMEIAFVSDTQAPMGVEKLILDYDQNERATRLIFEDIISRRPKSLTILGDVVSIGYKEKKWVTMDGYLDSCQKVGIRVSALLGNHDVMTRAKAGEAKFQKRFPAHSSTGFCQVMDSVAIVLLNSNFKKLSKENIRKQQTWLEGTLQSLDADPSILTTIVACHHAPYSNSKIVGSSKNVQNFFVPDFIKSSKSSLFITGHSHNFEHFRKLGKDFLVIGGGGGLSQPLSKSGNRLEDIASKYKPKFHYLMVTRFSKVLRIDSRYLKEDFSGFENGASFTISIRE